MNDVGKSVVFIISISLLFFGVCVCGGGVGCAGGWVGGGRVGANLVLPNRYDSHVTIY